MKKQVLVLMMAGLASFQAAAQSSDAEKNNKYPHMQLTVRAGIKGGLNIANLTIDNSGNVNDRQSILSYNAGVYADVRLMPVLYLQPGIFLTGKGAKFTLGDNESGNYTQIDIRPVYLELPVNMVVKLPLFNKVKLLAGAGPYLAVGVGGKSAVAGKIAGLPFSENTSINYSKDQSSGSLYDGDLKRFDAGVNFLAGLEISHFTLNANYGYGMSNIRSGSTSSPDSKYQHRVMTLQVGVLF